MATSNLIRTLAPLGALLAASACATTSGDSTSRTFRRPQLDDLPLESLDVVVSVSGPPAAAPPNFDIQTFPPPNWTSVLRAGEEDARTREALAAALRRELAGAGYRVRVLHGGTGSTEASSGAPGGLPLGAQAPAQTSTRAVGAPSAASASAAARPGEAPLPPDATLRDVLDASRADGVLVVRAVPVDAFYVFETIDDGTTTAGALGTRSPQAMRKERSVQRSGRLLVGQAFLFDRRTGLRLWSRQLPGMPEDGKLTSSSEVLRFGVLTEPGAREPMPDEKAAQAAAGFTQAMLEPFPAAQAGRPEAREALGRIDVSSEQAKQSFLDEGHVTIAVDTSWSLETAGMDVTLGEDVVDSLGTGAIAPNGVLRVTPRFGYQWPGGFVAAVGVPIGIAPNQFARTYHRDNPDPNAADPNDLGAQISVGRPFAAGIELTGGYAWLFDAQLMLHTTAGLFGEVWDIEAAPEGVLPTNRLYRFGVIGAGHLVYRFTETSPAFVQGGLRGRLGGANRGPVVVGLDLSLGLGVQF